MIVNIIVNTSLQEISSTVLFNDVRHPPAAIGLLIRRFLIPISEANALVCKLLNDAKTDTSAHAIVHHHPNNMARLQVLVPPPSKSPWMSSLGLLTHCERSQTHTLCLRR